MASGNEGWEDAPGGDDGWEDVPVPGAKGRHPLLSTLVGAIDGASFGTADEGAALQQLGPAVALDVLANPRKLLRPRELARGALGAYRTERDRGRAFQKELREANPKAYLAGELGGAVLMPVPGSGTVKGATLLKRAGQATKQGAAMGAAFGFGNSEADLTQGDVRGVAGDTAIGAAAGAAGGAVGETLLTGGRKLVDFARKRATAGIEKASADALAAAEKAKEKALAAARGALGGDTAATFKTFDRLREILADAIAPAELRASAQSHLDSPVFKEAMRAAQEEYVSKAGSMLARITKGREEVAEKAAVDVAEQATEALANPIRTQVVPRLKTYASRMLPIAMGSYVGGVPGTILGGVAAAAMGRPGTALANMARSPAVRKGAWEAVTALTGGATPEATVLATALRRSPRAIGSAAPVLSEATGLAPMLRRVADFNDEDDPEVRRRALAEALTLPR